LLFVAEKLPARSSGSHSIDKWFSFGDHDTKSFKKPVDFSAKPESTKTSAGQSDTSVGLPGSGIWGEFDSDSIPDAVLLMATDAVEQSKIKTEPGQSAGKWQFPGRGQKLSATVDSHDVPVESIVRRIPGIGVINSRSQPRDNHSSKQNTAATTSLPSHQSFFDNALSSRLPSTCSSDKRLSKASNSPVKYESAADFRRAVGMVMSPPGTEVRVKNFTSVCNHNTHSTSLNRKVPLVTPNLKITGRLLSDSDADVDVRPVKKLRSDTEDAKLNIAQSSDSKSLAGICNEQLQENVEELNTKHDSNKPSTGRGMIELSDEETASSQIDQAAVGGIGTVDCPVCQVPVPASIINEHLDQCLV